MSSSNIETLAAAILDGRLRVVPDNRLEQGFMTSGYRLIIDPPRGGKEAKTGLPAQAEGGKNDQLTLAEVAELTRTPAATLRYYRHLGTAGPRSFKVGRRIFYRRADVDAWIQEQYEAE